jgi:hypothetical protein
MTRKDEAMNRVLEQNTKNVQQFHQQKQENSNEVDNLREQNSQNMLQVKQEFQSRFQE